MKRDFERFHNLVFLAVVLVVLVYPLRGGLPAPADSLPPVSAGLSGYPLLDVLRRVVLAPAAYADRYTTHFIGQEQRVGFYNQVLWDVFKVHVFPNVLVGRDGWLFWTGEDNIEDYQNAHPFKPEELRTIQAKLDVAARRLNQKGISFLVVVAPNKETIYPEYLPPGIPKIGTQSRLDQLLEYMKVNGGQARLLDLRPALLAGKAGGQVYYATDTHWNDRGSYIAYAGILQALQADLPQLHPVPLADFHPQTEKISGDLAQLLLTTPLPSEQAERLVPEVPRKAHFLEKIDRVITISQVDDTSLPRAVILRDSFANSLGQYLSEDFSRAVYPWSFTLDFDLIEREHPQVVIYEIAERYLQHLKELL